MRLSPQIVCGHFAVPLTSDRPLVAHRLQAGWGDVSQVVSQPFSEVL